MAFTAAAAARHGGGRNSIMFMNNVPSIISKYHNQPADIDDPIAESEGEEHSKRDKKRDMTGDARLVNVVYSGLRTSEYCCAFFGLLGIGISIIEREQRWVYGLKDNTAIRVVLLSFNLLVTIFLLVSLYFSYKMMFNWMKARGLLGKYDDLINTGMYKSLLAEMFVCILSPLPFIPNETYNEYNNNFNVTIPQYYNDLLLAASFARIYLFIRCIVTNSYYMSTRAQRVCQMNGCYASYMFAIKCLMKDKAYLVLTTNLVLSMFYFGYLIRIFDQVLSTASGKNFRPISNPVWQTIITMTTVGYGDFFSLSTESRIICIFCAFYGVYLVSLFVIALDSVLRFDQAEERSYDLLCRLEDKEALKLEAVNVLTSAFRHRKAKKENSDSNDKSAVLDKLKTFRKYLMNFQKIAKAIRGNYGTENPNDSVRDEIDELRCNIKSLRGSLEALSDHFGVEMIDKKATSTNKSTDDSKKNS